MITTLAPLFSGSLSWLEDWAIMSTDAPAGVIAARSVFTPAELDRVIALYERHQTRGDPRAILSVWSGYYFATTIYIPLATQLLLNRYIPVELDRVSLVLKTSGEPRQLVIPHSGHKAPNITFTQCLQQLTNANLAPAIQALSGHNGLSPKVYWNNAAQYLVHLIDCLQAMPDVAEARCRQAVDVLSLRHFPDGQRNPFFRPMRDAGGGRPWQGRTRRLCCIRFRLPSLDYCMNCPVTCRARRG